VAAVLATSPVDVSLTSV